MNGLPDVGESIAVFQNGYVRIMDKQGAMDITLEDYNRIKYGTVLHHSMVIRPNSVISYLEEINPRLIGTEMSIERDKMRRMNQQQIVDMMKYAFPFVLIIIGAVIAFKMLTQGDSTGAAQTAGNVLAIK